MICENCKKEFFEDWRKYKEGLCKFCSRTCSNSRSHSKETKEKIGKSVSISSYERGRTKTKKICLDCNKEISHDNKSGYCSKCIKGRSLSKETKEKLSEAAKKNVREGKHQGWKTRNISSYPEIFFKKVMENNGLKYKFNHPVSKKSLGVDNCSSYFLDFYFEELKLYLEIDGKQHNYKDRAESDEERDKLLKKNGYIVYRIKWKSINSEEGKAYIKSEIDKFLDFYARLV